MKNISTLCTHVGTGAGRSLTAPACVCNSAACHSSKRYAKCDVNVATLAVSFRCQNSSTKPYHITNNKQTS